MKRIGRHVLDAVALLSLFLLLATAATWAYAAGRPSAVDFTWSSPGRHLDLRVRDDVYFHLSRQSTRVVGTHLVLRHVEVPGFWYDHELLNNAPAGSVDWYVADVRYWLACVALALLPAWRGGAAGVGRVRRWRRPPPPHACPSCGYDLRATPQRCPECGAAPDRANQIERQDAKTPR
jgi:hypothetical protein